MTIGQHTIIKKWELKKKVSNSEIENHNTWKKLEATDLPQ